MGLLQVHELFDGFVGLEKGGRRIVHKDRVSPKKAAVDSAFINLENRQRVGIGKLALHPKEGASGLGEITFRPLGFGNVHHLEHRQAGRLRLYVFTQVDAGGEAH
jgi:hypothetical protein